MLQMSLHENKCDLLFIMWICSFLQTPFEKYFKNQKMSFLRTKYCNSTLDYSCSSIKLSLYLTVLMALTGIKWQQNFYMLTFFVIKIFCMSNFCVHSFFVCLIFVAYMSDQNCQFVTVWVNLGHLWSTICWHFLTTFDHDDKNWLWKSFGEFCCWQFWSLLTKTENSWMSKNVICWLLQIK